MFRAYVAGMNPPRMVESDAQHIARWLTQQADALRDLPPLPTPVRLVHAANVFTAIGEAIEPLCFTSSSDEEDQLHRQALGIAIDAPNILADAAGHPVMRKYALDPSTLPSANLAPPEGLAPEIRDQLLRATHHAAAVTNELLSAILSDTSIPPDLRAAASKTGADAHLIEGLYHEDPHTAHMARISLLTAQQDRREQIEANLDFLDTVTLGGVYEPSEERIMAATHRYRS